MEETGFAACLTKPVRQSQLFDTMMNVLSDETHNAGGSMVTQPSIEKTQRSHGRILVAEDNIINQQVALGILNNLGHSSEAVANGKEVIKALESIPYELVLMDCQMPEMDGYEATRQVRHPASKVLNRHIPIIAMTAHVMQGDRKKCLEAGMNDYLSKPVDPQALADMIEKWLPQEKTTGQKTTHEPGKKQGNRTERDFAHMAFPVFDKEAMMKRLMDDEDLAQIVMEGFLDDMPKQIDALKGYLGTADVAGVERQAHTIKGASANVGAEALCEVAFGMEKAGKAGDLKAAKISISELEVQFERVKEAMASTF